ncbi:MAG: NAD(P)H-hydrate dehydratase [bacterium]
MKLADAREMKQIDVWASEKYKMPTSLLMERAGEAAVRVLIQKAGSLSGKKIGVLCGKGNNGGDGLVAARLLKKRKVSVTVFLAYDPRDLETEAVKQYQKAKAAWVPLVAARGAKDLAEAWLVFEKCDFFLDALLGTGISRPVEGATKNLILLMNQLDKPILSLDVPSGFSADRGLPLGEVVRAQWTVTFGLSKPGFYMPGAKAYTGEVETADLGLPFELLNSDFLKTEMTERRQVQAALPRFDDYIHKGIRGRVLVVAGSTGLTGAAALSAWGAQRVGAGLVTVACAKSLNPILASKLTECMTSPVAEAAGGFLSSRALNSILGLAEKADALVVGPGLGRHPETGRLLKRLLPRLKAPLVLDADGLTLLAGQWKLLKALRAPLIVTPHPGEAARLLGVSTAEVEQNRLKVAKQIAAEYNAVTVLKGRYTVIAHPSGAVRINPTGNRGLATGGTGDVLSGVLGGFLAQGLAPFDAAAAGVYLHGWAGERAARKLGPDGLMATDLLPIFPRLLRQTHEKILEPQCPSTPISKTSGKRSSSLSKSKNPGFSTI